MILARHMRTERECLSVSMQLDLGSTRASACPDRRLAGRNGSATQLPNGDSFVHGRVVGEAADHSTRGRVRSPTQSANDRFGCKLRALGLLLLLPLFGSG